MVRVALLLLLLSAACGSPATSDVSEITTRDSAGVTIVQYPPATVAGAPTWLLGDLLTTLGGPEADATHDMTGAEMGLLEDSGFLVGDQESVHIRRFSASGELLGTAGGRGEGPGELNSLLALLPAPDGFAVVDFSQQRLALYDDSLRFRRQVRLQELPGGARLGVFAVDRDGSIYTIGGPHRFPAPSPAGDILRDPLVVERIHSEGSALDTLFTLTGGEYYYIGSGSRVRRFGLQSFIHRTTDGFVSGDGERWEFQTRDPSGDVRRIVRLD